MFIFTAVSTLTTGAGADFDFIGGAQACNVFWRIGSSATIGTGAAFVGTVIAQASVLVGTNATIEGRLIAQTAAVTLLDNVFTAPVCTGGGDGTTVGTSTIPVDTTTGTPRAVVTPAADTTAPGLPATGDSTTLALGATALAVLVFGGALVSVGSRRPRQP